MDRYIIKYPNGKIRQQKGINGTIHYHLGLGIITWIIDIKKETIMWGDKDEHVQEEKITSYHDSDLIIEKEK